LFTEKWAGNKLREHYREALPLLESLYGVEHVSLAHEGGRETFLFVPPSRILERAPVRERVTAVGDGWLEAGGRRHEGWVYVAAGVWCAELVPGLGVYGKAGASFLFAGEREGRMRSLGPGRQAIAFVRDPGTTYFSDGTAERQYTEDHERQTLGRAALLGLVGQPVARQWGVRPY